MRTTVELTLAHSPDPDDAFMWWPLTGMVDRDGSPLPGERGRPALDTGRYRFRAVPADIETLNRRAAAAGDLEITALSVRAFADVQDRYMLTACGGSFGEGYGPKVVCRREASIRCEGCLRPSSVRIAVPGRRTTAFLTLGLALGLAPASDASRFVEMPFDRIIGAVARGEVDAGLIIHEGQLTFADAGLRQVMDLGRWWTERTALPLPLGVNAVRNDLDERFGPGTLEAVGDLLRRSVAHAAEHRAAGLEYAMSFAMANEGGDAGGGGGGITPERVGRFVGMYVNELTADMGTRGLRAIEQLLAEGAGAGLCPAPATPLRVL